MLARATIAGMSSGPKFIRFFWPIVEALRDLGGAAPPREAPRLGVAPVEER